MLKDWEIMSKEYKKQNIFPLSKQCFDEKRQNHIGLKLISAGVLFVLSLLDYIA